MPTEIQKGQTVTIGEDEVEVSPLKIKKLRDFMKAFNKLTKVDLESEEGQDEQLSIIVECAVIALSQAKPALAKKTLVEDLCTLDDLYRIIEGASGIRLDAEGNLGKGTEVPGMI